MDTINAAARPGAPNYPEDVETVQRLLIRHKQRLGEAAAPSVTRQFDGATAQAIIGFQKDGAALAHPDGMVSARGATLKRLQLAVIVGPKRRVFWPVCWRHIDDTLTDSDYASAASTLDCAAAAIQAVADTEARGDPWDRSGRPLILFERHKFARHTRGVYNRSHPDISAPRWGGHGSSDG